MNKGLKRLAQRVTDWNDLPTMGQSGNTKQVRRHDGKGSQDFHKPGSQNRRK